MLCDIWCYQLVYHLATADDFYMHAFVKDNGYGLFEWRYGLGVFFVLRIEFFAMVVLLNVEVLIDDYC